MIRCARGVVLATTWLLALAGCRDWDQFEGGEGGASASSSSSGGAGPGSTTSSATTTGSGGAGGQPAGVGGGGGDATGGGGAGGGVADECGTIAIMSDTFDAASLDWRWRNVPDFVSLVEGDLVYSYPTDGSWFEVFATSHYDMEGRSFVFEIDTPPGPGTGLWIDLGVDYDNYVEYYLAPNGELRYGQEVDGAFGIFANEPFDMDDHRFLRFREEAGTMYFDTSGDGVTWVEQHDVAGMFDPAHTTLWLGGHSDDPIDPGAEARLARIYAEPGAGGEPCSAATIDDDFEDGQRSEFWNAWEAPGCPIVESDGELAFECVANAFSDSGYGTWSVYDFTGLAATIEVVEYGTAENHGYGFLGLGRPESETYWVFGVDHGDLLAREVVNGSFNNLELAAYDATQQRFLRMREAGGQLYFETSPDGVTFTEFEQRTVSFPVTELGVFVLGGSESDADARIAFDDLTISAP